MMMMICIHLDLDFCLHYLKSYDVFTTVVSLYLTTCIVCSKMSAFIIASRRRTEEWKREVLRMAATNFRPMSRRHYRRHVQLDVLSSANLLVYT